MDETEARLLLDAINKDIEFLYILTDYCKEHDDIPRAYKYRNCNVTSEDIKQAKQCLFYEKYLEIFKLIGNKFKNKLLEVKEKDADLWDYIKEEVGINTDFPSLLVQAIDDPKFSGKKIVYNTPRRIVLLTKVITNLREVYFSLGNKKEGFICTKMLRGLRKGCFSNWLNYYYEDE